MKKERIRTLKEQCGRSGPVISVWAIVCLVWMLSIGNAMAGIKQQTFTLELKNVKIEQVLKSIRQESKMKFIYNVEEVSKYAAKDIMVNNVDINTLMKAILSDTKLSWRMDDDVVVILPENQSTPQQQQANFINISGKVTDEKGNAIPGATVMLAETKLGTATNGEGEFKLAIPEQKEIVLICSFIGMETKIIKYNGEKVLKIVLDRKSVV